MKHYLGSAIIPFVYLFFSAVIAIGINMLDSVAIRLILHIVNLAFYLFVICAVAFKNGETAYKVLLANDMERREIIRTGENRPLKLKEEFTPVKGYLIGLIPSAPLFILLIVQAILTLSGSEYIGLGAIANFLYSFGFINCFVEDPTGWQYFYSLIALPLISFANGFPYYLGAMKIRLQRQRIEESKQHIYGE